MGSKTDSCLSWRERQLESSCSLPSDHINLSFVLSGSADKKGCCICGNQCQIVPLTSSQQVLLSFFFFFSKTTNQELLAACVNGNVVSYSCRSSAPRGSATSPKLNSATQTIAKLRQIEFRTHLILILVVLDHY